MTEMLNGRRGADELVALREIARTRYHDLLDPQEPADDFVRWVHAGLKKGQRTAILLYWDAVKRGLENNSTQAQQIFIQLGARDERDARRKIALVTEADELTPEQQLVEMAEHVERLITADATLRDKAIALLAPVLEPKALLPLTNGAAR